MTPPLRYRRTPLPQPDAVAQSSTTGDHHAHDGVFPSTERRRCTSCGDDLFGWDNFGERCWSCRGARAPGM